MIKEADFFFEARQLLFKTNHHCGAKDRYSYAFGSAEGLESSMSRARTCTWSAQGGDIVTTYMYVVRSQVVNAAAKKSNSVMIKA